MHKSASESRLGIPRTQAGRSGSGPEARRPSSRAIAPLLLADHGPTPSTYAATAATAPAHVIGSGAARGRAAAGSGPGGNRPPSPHPAAHAAGAGATRSSSASPGGLGPPYTLASTRVGKLVPPGPGH